MQAWPNELNLDPRQRVTAALGTQVVQREQEQLMAAAWEQLEAVQAANQAMRLRQLAQATHDTLLDNTIRHLSEDDLLQVTAPAHTRLGDVRGHHDLLCADADAESHDYRAVSGQCARSERVRRCAASRVRAVRSIGAFCRPACARRRHAR